MTSCDFICVRWLAKSRKSILKTRMMQSRCLTVLLGTLLLTGCATLELGTAISLTKLTPTEIDPRSGRIAILWPEAFTHYRPPFTDFKATKDNEVQIEGQFKFITDPKSANFVPRNPNEPGELIIYAVDAAQYPMAYKAQDVLRDQKETDKLFGGSDWEMNTHTDFSFTVERAAYRAYCTGEKNLDISIWVKANANKPFQRLSAKGRLQKTEYKFDYARETCLTQT